MNRHTKDSGFSIIEVVLVLAIAGLIFLMVFIALPALQRSQRDSARQQEASAVVGAISTYGSANNGKVPTTAAQISAIITGKDDGKLESGADIQIRSTAYGQPITVTADSTVSPAADNVVALDELLVYIGYKCGDTTNGAVSLVRGTSRQASVITIQESGGANGSAYCKSS